MYYETTVVSLTVLLIDRTRDLIVEKFIFIAV